MRILLGGSPCTYWRTDNTNKLSRYDTVGRCVPSKGRELEDINDKTRI